MEGALLAIADKVDTIVGMFGLGLEPTGSKDPFALRRAANGIVKILAEGEPALPLTLGDVVDAASPDDHPTKKDRSLGTPTRLYECAWRFSSRSGWSSICARRRVRRTTW